MLRTAIALLFVAGLATGARAGNDPGARKSHSSSVSENVPRISVEPLGLDSGLDGELVVGTYAPDFGTDGSLGAPVSLADLKGHWSVMVFSDTRSTFAALTGIDDRLRDRDVDLYGICPEAAPALATYADREEIRFPLLSDKSRQIAQDYGMYDSEHDVIRPGLVILDPLGVVRMSRLGLSFEPREIQDLVAQTMAGV